jgi:rSAM/selenodomain-associated transferase 1
MKDTIVVFARAPRLGTVKRRLAAVIGARAALRFHRQVLLQLVRGLAVDSRFRTIVAITPDCADLRLPARVARLPQGPGDVGKRMHRVFRRFRRGRVAIIGTDIPQASAVDVAAAFQALGRADAVFGPATDGGYWLVGLGPQRPARPFANVRWSTENALADTLANFADKRIAQLRTLSDVDTAADWQRFEKARDQRSSHWGPRVGTGMHDANGAISI